MEGPNSEAGKEKREFIIGAALRADGKIYQGHSHSEAIDAYQRKFPNTSLSELEEGFITNTGRFVSREEASRIVGMD